MNILPLVLKRNNTLMWENIRIRLILITLVDTFIVMRSGSLEVALQGAVITASEPILPINWFFLVLSPFMIVGDYPESVIKRDYPLVSSVSLSIYLTSVVIQLIGVTSVVVILWGLVAVKSINLIFFGYVFVAINILVLLYGLVATLLGSIGGQLMVIIMLLITTGSIYIPVLSSLMMIHFTEGQVVLDLLLLLLLVVILLWSPAILKKIEFDG